MFVKNKFYCNREQEQITVTRKMGTYGNINLFQCEVSEQMHVTFVVVIMPTNVMTLHLKTVWFPSGSKLCKLHMFHG